MKVVSLISYHHISCDKSIFHHNNHRRFTYTTVPPPQKHLQVVSLRQPSCSFRLKSSSENNSSTKTETPHQENEKLVNRVKKPESESESGPVSFVFTSLSFLRDRFKLDQVGWEIVSIALPAALALAADPLTSLVDTAFVGHLGSVELAAVGVSASVFNLVSKLFNVPLLNVTTAFVAEEQAFITKGCDHYIDGLQDKKVLPSVSTSLVLAATIGVAEAVALSVGSGFLMNTMGFTNACTS